MLEIDVRKRLGSFALDVALTVPPRSVLVLVGESGSGKSTLLRLIAGLIDPDSGRIALSGRILTDPTLESNAPARNRPIGYVAQDYALFPHLSARENVAFGLRAVGTRGHEVAERVDRALGRLGVADLGSRRPHELSGGQQQRVALARAIVLEPEILLLDEPLAALDLRTRMSIRTELKRLLSELECLSIFVTHSPTEALAFGERICVLESGRITQMGSRDDLLQRPRSRYVADFLGTNLFPAIVRAREQGMTRLSTGDGEIAASESELEGDIFAIVDPREIVLSREFPIGSAQNVLRGPVVDIQPEPPNGDRLRVSLATRPRFVAEVTRAAAERMQLVPGLEVYAAFKATGVRVFQ